jgi:hypothetical protein
MLVPERKKGRQSILKFWRNLTEFVHRGYLAMASSEETGELADDAVWPFYI